ncbi:LysR family transcriptional regulator [Massilia sp. BSC265]|uniref:LysR family transcriptional regulator n=1 Tax=Massilia sp. BSC265 TaxID=1549812 RepID=UPI0004E91FD4|nr:LysR family transcriptional regulator [Massilia sp. BSC265]KFI08911.1 LysR family transcriptional regulator [Massilia sp. BSC265]
MKTPPATLPTKLGLPDLETILALHRGRTLARAAERLRVDASTVFRAVRRIERDIGDVLFDRGRHGYTATALGRALAAHAERIEQQLEAARETAFNQDAAPSGLLRITLTETLFHTVLLPVLPRFAAAYPHIALELVTSNAIANLGQREADIAIRVTNAPPEHLVGIRLGTVRSAVWGGRDYLAAQPAGMQIEELDWISLDDSLPEHPSRIWRRDALPKVAPRYKVGNLLAVAGAVVNGLGVGVVPLAVMRGHPQVEMIGEPLPELDIGLWVLAHPDTRYLGRMKAMFDFLRTAVKLPGDAD